MGILRFSNDYPNEIMESACQEALDKRTYAYKYFSIIIRQSTAKFDKNNIDDKVIHHDNIRGREAFIGGGINA